MNLAQLAAAARRHGTAARRGRIPRSVPPLLIESDYGARLVGIVDRVRDASRHVLADLPLILRSDALRLDDTPGRRARRTMERVRVEAERATTPNRVETLATDFGKRVAAQQKALLDRQTRAALGIDAFNLDQPLPNLIDAFAHENVSLITSLEGKTLDDIEKLVTRAVTEGRRAEEVAAEIEERFGIAERHARLIARDQIGKLNGQITAARHLELGIASYIWRTMRDPKVRPTHKPREGQQYTYRGPGQAPALPGAEICCRCVPEPVFDNIYAELEALGA